VDAARALAAAVDGRVEVEEHVPRLVLSLPVADPR
jgi:hypothetical protein